MILGPRSWWRHRTWEPVEAKLIDSRFVHRYANDGVTYQTWDHMVETVDESGRATRLEKARDTQRFEEKLRETGDA